MGCNLTLSAAVSISPFRNASGRPSEDVSEFAEYLDYIGIMNYDIWGSWSASVGPDAPLNDTCASPANQQGSAVSAVKAWTDAGFPRSQILLGLPAYGHSFAVSTSDAFVNGTVDLVLYAKFNASLHPAGDAWDDQPGVDACGAQQNYGGVINFWGLVAEGYLDDTGHVVDGIPYVYDTCSQTVCLSLLLSRSLLMMHLPAVRLQHHHKCHDLVRQRAVLCCQGRVHCRQRARWFCYLGGWRRLQ